MKKFSLSLCVLGSAFGLTGTDAYATCDSTLTMLRNEGQALIKMLTTYNEGSGCYSNCDKKYP